MLIHSILNFNSAEIMGFQVLREETLYIFYNERNALQCIDVGIKPKALKPYTNYTPNYLGKQIMTRKFGKQS